MMRFRLFSVFVFGLLCIPAAYAQHIQTELQTPSGRVYTIGPDAQYVISGLGQGPMTIELTPETGYDRAKALVQDGTETIVLEAKTLRFFPGRDDFVLEGECTIQRTGFELHASKRIEFDSKSNRLMAEGTAERPVDYEYLSPRGTPVRSKAEVIHFLFVESGGHRVLDRVKIIRGHRATTIVQPEKDGEKKSEKTLFRKSNMLQ